ncbi:MAG: HNH endonuclease signature motif containing protein [Candidatus Paceibacterota bacterium]|jgi:hypothetical protein
MRKCENCSCNLVERHKIKFCSIQCQKDYQYHSYIAKWRNGNEAGVKGTITKNISGHLKRYLLGKYKEKCAKCGWSKKHPITGRVPLEVDHIDGNSDNNVEKNLILLCPNCHALTPYFRNLNKGQGRKWRKTLKEYIIQR